MNSHQDAVIESERRALPLLFAFVAALVGAVVVLRNVLHQPFGLAGSDIDQIWWAARELLRGHDPYATLPTSAFAWPFLYPLPAALIGLPLGFLPLEASRLIWVIGTAGLLGYAVGKYRPELWPCVLGVPFLTAVRSSQWSPLLTAGMILPVMGWVAAAKPNIGLAMLAGTARLRDAKILIIGGVVLCGVALAIDPHWPQKWLDALARAPHYRALLFRPGGFLVLLALLRWRDPDARLVLVLGLVPINGLFYDVLPASLVARTRQQAIILALASLVGWHGIGLAHPSFPTLTAQLWFNGTVVLWCALLPALVLVLRRGVMWPVWAPAKRERA